MEWIASLSDGTVIKRSDAPRNRSPWLWLRSYINDRGLMIMGLSLVHDGQEISVPGRFNEDGVQTVERYWYSGKMSAITGSVYMDLPEKHGIGYVVDGKIYITWMSMDGSIEYESREATEDDLAII
jgi:hypothetical protein